KVAPGHRADHARHFVRGPDQVADERVDRLNHARPVTTTVPERGALGKSTVLADDFAHTLKLPGCFCVKLKYVVERIGNFPVDPGPFNRQANGEVAILDRHQGTQKQLGIQVTIYRGLHCCGLLVGLLDRHGLSPSLLLKMAYKWFIGSTP